MADEFERFEKWQHTRGQLLPRKRRWQQHPNTLAIGFEVEQELVEGKWRDIPGTMRPIKGYDHATHRFLGDS